jgi:hypothetical protein
MAGSVICRGRYMDDIKKTGNDYDGDTKDNRDDNDDSYEKVCFM